jgi:uncharacterized protein
MALNNLRSACLVLCGLLLLPLLASADIFNFDRAFYYPDHQSYGTPAQQGLVYEKVRFQSHDGTSLTGWFMPARPPVHGTVIQFHGNMQNISSQYLTVAWLPKNGFNLFVFDYRGYGDSGGVPSRRGVYEDGVAALQYIESRPEVKPGTLVVFGQSLGAALAITVVGENHFTGLAGVAAESGFSSYEDVAADHYSLLGNIFVSDSLSPLAAVPKISPIPLLIIHGTADTVVPYYHAKKLYAAAREPKELWTITGGGHVEALGRLQAEYEPRLLNQFLAWVNAAQSAPSVTPAPTTPAK